MGGLGATFMHSLGSSSGCHSDWCCLSIDVDRHVGTIRDLQRLEKRWNGGSKVSRLLSVFCICGWTQCFGDISTGTIAAFRADNSEAPLSASIVAADLLK
jgi:hypothetical protein